MERKDPHTETATWHKPPAYTKKLPKQILPHTAGSCPHCHKHVDNLEAHIHDKHLGAKLPAKK